MPRETKEQRQNRLAAEENLALIQRQNFRNTMPEKLMELQAMASECGVNTRVTLTASGPCVEFTRYDYDHKGTSFEQELTYDSEEWHVEHVEHRMREFKKEIDARAARKVLAEEVWKGLRAEQKAAVVEFITYLR